MSEFRPGRFQVLPLVIKNLLIINGLVWLAQLTMLQIYDLDLSRILGLFYWGSDSFRPYQFVTHLFLHDPRSIWHLASNMFALWMFGSTLENIWGPKRFLIFYMICGIGAALCYMGVLTWENMQLSKDVSVFFNNPSYETFQHVYNSQHLGDRGAEGFLNEWSRKAPEDPSMIWQAKYFLSDMVQKLRDIPIVGASGAVFGILFAFGYLFPNRYLFILPIPFPIKVKYFIGGYILMEVFLGIQNAANDNVAHFAHVGGAFISFILLRIWNKRNRRDFY